MAGREVKMANGTQVCFLSECRRGTAEMVKCSEMCVCRWCAAASVLQQWRPLLMKIQARREVHDAKSRQNSRGTVKVRQPPGERQRPQHLPGRRNMEVPE